MGRTARSGWGKGLWDGQHINPPKYLKRNLVRSKRGVVGKIMFDRIALLSMAGPTCAALPVTIVLKP
ncbi:MAG: hypothetical protein AAF217_12390 [Pseudomonadota bacterium]